MLQSKFAGCMFVLAAIAISSAQNTVPAAQPQGNSQTQSTPANPQTNARMAPGSIPQQQPMWRPGQQVQAKPSPQVPQSAQQNSAAPTNGANLASPANKPAVTAIRPAIAQPQRAATEPTTGASITWPGATSTRVTPLQPAVTSAALTRPATTTQSPVAAPAASAMPIAQPMVGSAGRAGIDYHAGLLSVVAENAELGKLMRLIGNKTGAQIDVAADVANELVMAHLGPASPNEVLTALLDSSHLTYIMIGEDKVSKVVVRRRYGTAPAPMVARHRNLGFPEPAADTQATTTPQEPTEQAADSGVMRPAGEMAPPAIPSRSPLMRAGAGQAQQAGQSQAAEGSQPVEAVDVRGQVGGTEAPEQPESNPPQQ